VGAVLACLLGNDKQVLFKSLFFCYATFWANRREISTKEMPQKYLIRSFLLLDYYKKFAKTGSSWGLNC